MTDQTKQPFTFTGWHMLAAMVAFFGVIIAVNVTMAIIATGTWTGLVVPNSYVASQEYNDHLAVAREQQARGWRSNISYEEGRLVVEIVDADNRGIVLGQMRAWIGRPAFEQEDHVVDLVSDGDGLYSIRHDLAPGPWLVRLDGGDGTTAYRHDARISVGSPENKASESVQ